MSSRFVSGGTILPGSEEETKDAPGSSSTPADTAAPREQLSNKNAEWEAVQKELEADRKRREEQRLKAATGEEKSLYDILQANKAAKQAAFEEQNKIKNQFRALDDDEVEFLDDVMAAKRQEEEKVKRETEEGLKAFRERQRRTSVGGGGDEQTEEIKGGHAEVEDWGVGRKRKRVKERDIKVKRKASSSDADGHGDRTNVVGEEEQKTKAAADADAKDNKPKEEKEKAKKATTAVTEPVKKSTGLALVDYGSDESD